MESRSRLRSLMTGAARPPRVRGAAGRADRSPFRHGADRTPDGGKGEHRRDLRQGTTQGLAGLVVEGRSVDRPIGGRVVPAGLHPDIDSRNRRVVAAKGACGEGRPRADVGVDVVGLPGHLLPRRDDVATRNWP